MWVIEVRELYIQKSQLDLHFCFDFYGRNEGQYFSMSVYYILLCMQIGQTQTNRQFSESRTINIDETGPSLQVKVMQGKKKLIVSDLNINNPEDRALSLCLKMVEMRKRREEKQNKLIKQIRRSRVLDCSIGQISKTIARDQFIARHEYLREAQYRIDRPKIVINRALGGSHLIGQEKKKAMQRQIEVLEKSKQLTHRYQIKRIIKQILEEVINYSIIMHQRKKKFHPKGQILAPGSALEKEWERRAKGKKGSLSFSRVIDLKMAPSDESQNYQNSDENEEESKQQNQQNSDKSEQDAEKQEQDQDQQSSQKEQKEEQDVQVEQSISSDHV